MADCRARLQEIISETGDRMLDPLLEIFAGMDFDVIESPEASLIMMNIKDHTQTVFHLGEVLVTRAKVGWNQYAGYGCCLGEQSDGAVALACLDALAAGDCRDHQNDIGEVIRQIQHEVFLRRNTDDQMTVATKVDFRSMAEE
jgi:alpha-D-ribose 1-methylphosphonate 5-triphosphate synthase subunit PhnG